MKINSSGSFILRPESAQEVSKYAKRALRAAGAVGKLPTPIDELLAAAKVGNLKIDEDVKENFSARLAGPATQAFKTMWQKIRGIADIRKRVTYVDENTSQPRILFAKGHELGHQVLPWHELNPGYFDDDKILMGNAEEIFDAEANFFSAEVIFQGDNFTPMVRDYTVGFDTIFHLAERHGASYHATAWRYIEEQDEAVALIPYWPCPNRFNPEIFHLGKIVASPKFQHKFSSIDIPQELTQGQPWIAAYDSDLVQNDMISLDCDAGAFRFEWEAWWNSYTLFVILRQKPKLHLIHDLAEKISVVSHR